VIRQSIWARVTTRDDVIDFLAQRDDHMASVVEKRCWTAGGVALGVIVTATYSTTQNWPTVVPAWASTGGITATLIIGAIAGLYPAIWAARLAPTEALATTLPAICTLQRQAGGRLDEEIERLRALRQPSPRRLKAQHPTGTGEPIGSPIGQAIKAHAAAIVTEAIAYEFAANGYKSAIAAPVPVVATANGTPAGFRTARCRPPSIGETLQSKLIADWFAADANGSAHILYLANNSASIVKYDRAAKEEFADACPSCSATYID
jgi:hypothetical protein